MSDSGLAELVRALAADATPVVPLASWPVRLARWVAVTTVAVGVGVAVIGPRHDLAAALRDAMLPSQVGLLLATMALAAVAALRLAVPGQDRRGARLLAVALLAAWPAGLLARHVAAGGGGAEVAAEPLHTACALIIASVALVPAVALARMVRQGAPLMPAWSAAMAGLAAVAAGSVAVSLICPIGRTTHLLVAHATPAVVFTAVATAAAARWMTTRAVRPAGGR